MAKQLLNELTQVRDLINRAKLDEAFEIIENLERVESLSPKDQLSALLMKGRIFLYKQRTRKALQSFEVAHQMSQDLRLAYESIEALIGKAYIGFLGDYDKGFSYVKEAERSLNSLADDPPTGILRRGLLEIKSWIMFFKGNHAKAAKLAQECLKLTEEEKFGNKLDLAATYFLLGWNTTLQGNQHKALDYNLKSLEINKELNHAVAIAANYWLMASLYTSEGEYDQALLYCKQSLSIKEITKRDKLGVLGNIALIYRFKGKLNKAIKYRLQAITLAEELNIPDGLISNLISMGHLYIEFGEINPAIEYFERSLIVSEKWGLTYQMAWALQYLVAIYLGENLREKANHYFSLLTDLYNQTKTNRDNDISNFYLFSKALIMKTSTRMRDRVEAQTIFKEIIQKSYRISDRDSMIFVISNLCDLLLEELSLYNDPGILDEILSLVTKSLEWAEEVNNYNWLAEVKFLQAKIALIQMNIKEAKRLMVEAQRIADLHGLNRLAMRISIEHDKLLDQVDVWDRIKKNGAPMAERIKLASTDVVLERIQGKSVVEQPKLVEEQPILLLIIDNSGITYFNHQFVANWDYSDLFSSFMSAFNTFSNEIFSKSIDRIRIGENTILINPIESLLACYVVKGQSYPALQKLIRFTKAIRENSEIWQTLNLSIKTSEILGLDKLPGLKTLINEIFTEE